MSDLKFVQILLTDIHKTIEEYSNQFVEQIDQSLDLVYPPGVEIEEHIEKAFLSIELDLFQKEAMKLAIKDLNAQILFDLLAKIDGVADPEFIPLNTVWPGLQLVEKHESSKVEMLHDEFLEKYWCYKKSKA